uniref:Uncharacterized protein n=1 Tax=Meloidogyne floridensis TaxID=298350 RepID=A0A915P7E1_9BILA
MRPSFKLGVGEAILALNSLNITVLDGENVQQISVILDDIGSFNDLSTTWNANNNDEQNGNGEDALNGLRTRITTKISILVDVFVITINVGNGFLGLLNQHFLRRALERIQQKTTMLGEFYNNEANVEEVENDENVPPWE